MAQVGTYNVTFRVTDPHGATDDQTIALHQVSQVVLDLLPFRELEDWMDDYRRLWDARLDKLAAHLAQRKKQKKDL